MEPKDSRFRERVDAEDNYPNNFQQQNSENNRRVRQKQPRYQQNNQ